MVPRNQPHNRWCYPLIPTVTTSAVKVYELDFGPLGTTAPEGKLCGDGCYRAGKVRISISDSYNNTVFDPTAKAIVGNHNIIFTVR